MPSQSPAGYVRQAPAATGVPTDAVGYEVSDTATTCLGMAERVPDHAGRDLMLDQRLGWYLGAETRPEETSVVLCCLVGEAVPPPAAVALFVTENTAGMRTDRLRPVPPVRTRPDQDVEVTG